MQALQFTYQSNSETLRHNYMMNLIQLLMERVRTLVGTKGWDYCVLWILSDDQRYIEWTDCCCSGAQNSLVIRGDELHFPVSSVLPCRDVIFQHPRTKSCELLAHLPSSIPLDSGIHAQTLLSNQPRWFNFSTSSDTSVLNQGTVGTRALIPVPGGLIELFVTKQVAEDQHVIDFVTSQCKILVDQEGILNSTNNMDTNFHFVADEENEEKDNNEKNNQFQQESLNLPPDITADRIHLCSPPMNLLHQFCNYSDENKAKTDDDIFFEGAAPNDHMVMTNNDKDSIKLETNNDKDSIICNYTSDCSDQIDDENDGNGKYRRSGRGAPAKNLQAERRRRKRLNGRLYELRALVPKISNLNKAAILGDAIEFLKELKKQEKDLEDELQEHSDDGGGENGNQNKIPQEILNQDGDIVNGFHIGSSEGVSCSKLNHKTEITHHDHKAEQMEVQVEVAQINANDFFVKVFCEHKPGGFVRLMEALDSLGLEVTNANVNSYLGLVSNVLKVEKKDSEMVQADYVRESLLELTRDPPRERSDMPKASENDYARESLLELTREPPRERSDMPKASENGSSLEYHHHHDNHHLHNGHVNSNHHHLHN